MSTLARRRFDLSGVVRSHPRHLSPFLIIIAVACQAVQAQSAERNIYPINHATTPWTFEDVNDYLDPASCAANGGGPYGEPCPVAGETIVFNGHDDGTVGIYRPPVWNSYKLKTSNVDVTCNNAGFRGTEENSQPLWFVDSGNNTIYGCDFKRGIGEQQRGVIIRSGFDPDHPVTVTGNTFEGFEKPVVYWRVDET